MVVLQQAALRAPRNTAVRAMTGAMPVPARSGRHRCGRRQNGPAGPDLWTPVLCQGHDVVIAKETTLQELLEGSKQYRVPLYQRTYSWGEAQLKRLWDDVEKLAEDRRHDPAATHFIG